MCHHALIGFLNQMPTLVGFNQGSSLTCCMLGRSSGWALRSLLMNWVASAMQNFKFNTMLWILEMHETVTFMKIDCN